MSTCNDWRSNLCKRWGCLRLGRSTFEGQVQYLLHRCWVRVKSIKRKVNSSWATLQKQQLLTPQENVPRLALEWSPALEEEGIQISQPPTPGNMGNRQWQWAMATGKRMMDTWRPRLSWLTEPKLFWFECWSSSTVRPFLRPGWTFPASKIVFSSLCLALISLE